MNPNQLELETINTVIKGLKKQIKTLENRVRQINNDSPIYKCELTGREFISQQKLDIWYGSKKYNEAAGNTGTKCSQCNIMFYGNGLVKHVEDGRCAKSRTCKGCKITFSNMMSKSRHTCSNKCSGTDSTTDTDSVSSQEAPKKKKLKLKLKTKTKPPSPLPLPPLLPPTPQPQPDPAPVKPKESMFTMDPIKYKLKPLPDSCDEITPQFYENLHSGINKKDVYFEDMESESSIIDNCFEDFPMYSKGNIIYYKEDDTKAFKLDFNGGKYYKLITLYEEEEKKEEIIENLICLTSLEEKNMCAEIYQNLHKHHTLSQPDFLPAEFHRKFNENIADIRDCAYQNKEYLYYNHDGYLCRGDEKLFRFFKHSSGLFYDIEALETNECDSDYAEELIKEFEEDDNYN
jgi:hypothetical protein